MKKQLKPVNKTKIEMGSIRVNVDSKHLLFFHWGESVNIGLCIEIVTDNHLQNKYFHLRYFHTESLIFPENTS